MFQKIFPLALLVLGQMLFAQNWLLDLEEAQNQAKESNKTILMVFKGSDWCGPCKKLDKYVWETESFKEFATNHLVLVEVDFPRRKENKLSEEQQQKNNALAEKYNLEGYFPLVVLLDKELSVLGKTTYNKMTAEEYIEHLKSFIP